METRLTEREKSVLILLVKGFKNDDIANELNVSVHTVKAHLEAIYEKLEVVNRVQAVVRALQLGLIEVDDIQ